MFVSIKDADDRSAVKVRPTRILLGVNRVGLPGRVICRSAEIQTKSITLGIWLDILRCGAAGRIEDARRLLSEELPLSLRSYGSDRYKGPVPKAIAQFIVFLPSSDQPVARSYQRELADYIVDDVVDSVRESLALVQLCLAQPEISIEELARVLPWKEGLKRSADQKRQRVINLLKSMIACDIPLPLGTVTILGDRGEAAYPFDEVAYAAAPKRLQQSWKDFKRQQELDANFLCMTDEADAGVASEGFDYGSISIARVVLNLAVEPEFEATLDMYVIGKAIGPELTGIMESMHVAQPHDGYRPIAWHNVFWEVAAKYDTLVLALDERAPFCETVQALADHIASTYAEVTASSRPSISRRRTRLYGACEELVHGKIREYFGMAA
jgi:hypothetical protein